MIFESNTANFNISKKVIGFSGYQLKSPRKRIRDFGYLVRMTIDQYSIIIYYNPVVMDFHLPQDAIGVSIGSNGTINFALSDGVSIVNKKIDNDSGLLAHNLVNQVSFLQKPLWTKMLTNIGESFLNKNYTGAATVLWGRIASDQTTTKCKILSVGELYDLGTTKLITSGGTIDLINGSSGFIPKHNKPTCTEVYLPHNFTLIASTDGVVFSPESFEQLSASEVVSMRIDELTEFLRLIIEPNKDDQSLLIIQRS